MPATPTTSRARSDEAAGFAFTVGAFLIWGLSPIFWKAIDGVSAFDMLAHRIVWCALIMAGVLWLTGQWRGMASTLRRPATAVAMFFSTLCIGANWFLYIWAVTNGKILQASLGYFINPLVTVLLGLLFLGERLNRMQWASVATAAVGVTILAIQVGSLPWVSLALAGSFAIYGLLRKTVAASPEQGLALETWLLTPICLFWIARSHQAGEGVFGSLGLGTDILLILTGAITAVPLLFFTHGARRLPLSTVGILQYLAPTCQFLLAVFAYGEPFDRGQLLAFSFIWAALVLFALSRKR